MKEKGFWESGRGWKERPCHAISFSAGRKDRGQRPIGERIANVVTLTGRLPFVMLQTKPLQDLLSQALSPSIHTAVLATPQGTLITHSVVSLPNSSFTETEARRRHTRSLGAIATAIWKSYATINNVDDLFAASNGTSGEAERRDGLVWLSIECEVKFLSHSLCIKLTFRMAGFLFIRFRLYQRMD